MIRKWRRSRQSWVDFVETGQASARRLMGKSGDFNQELCPFTGMSELDELWALGCMGAEARCADTRSRGMWRYVRIMRSLQIS